MLAQPQAMLDASISKPDSSPQAAFRTVVTITPAMIEAGASAMRDVVSGRTGRAKPWAKLPDNIKGMYRREAEAAISAALAQQEGTAASI
jgi:hypothetical protein